MQQCNDLLGNSVRPEKFFKIQWGHINDGFVADRNGFWLFVSITLYPEQRTGADHIVPPIQLEKFQRSSRVRTILNLIQNQNRFACFKDRIFSHQRRQKHGNVVNFQRTGKNRSILRIDKKVQIDNVFIVLFCKIQNRERLAALSAPFENQWFVIRRVLPIR